MRLHISNPRLLFQSLFERIIQEHCPHLRKVLTVLVKKYLLD